MPWNEVTARVESMRRLTAGDQAMENNVKQQRDSMPTHAARKIAITSVLVYSLLGGIVARAVQVPYSTANWTGAQGSTVSEKSTPSGLRVRVTLTAGTNGAPTVQDVANTTAMNAASGITTVPVLPNGTNALSLITNVRNCEVSHSASLTCDGLGAVVIDFLDAAGNPVPVRNPRLHIARLGGNYYSATSGQTLNFGVTLSLSTAGVSLGSPSSPSLTVAGTTIRHSAVGTSTGLECTTNSTTSAGCGTVPMVGTTSQLAFNVGALRNTTTVPWTVGSSSAIRESYEITVTFDEDFGDAPASYDTPGTAAASHLIGNLTLGSTVTAENASTFNLGTIEPSPIANATASSDSGDDGATFTSISTVAGHTYTQAVALSGASRAGQVCGWIDFNKSGAFDTGERACAAFASGATSANLTWTVPSGVTAGTTVARLRASYDTSGVQSPLGLLHSGEVEDYEVTLAVPATIRVQKALPNGRAQATDQFSLSMTGTGAPAAVVTTGTGSTVSSAALTHTTAVAGSSYTLSEAASGSTLLANYTSTYACTNARAGGQTPSGSGTSISLTPVAGDDLTCTFRNALPPAVPFTCDATLYLSQTTGSTGQLYTVNRASNPFTYPTLGPSGPAINAVGYNPADNFLYGLRTESGDESRRLYRVDATGAHTDLGLVAGLPIATGGAYFSGAFSAAGDNLLYVMTSAGGNTMYRVNVATMTATPLTLSRSLYFPDLDYANGLFYAYETAGQLVSINPATGTVTNLGSASPAATFGAFWADSGGLYGVQNVAGGFYRFDPATGQRTLISHAPPSGGNDGARCPLGSPMTFAADLAITKTDGNATYTSGTNVVYTIVASNNGPFGAQNVRVQDALPAGITTATWTCTAANGAVCRTASGSGAINALVDLPFNTSGAASTATFTLTMAVPSAFTGNLVNTATVTVGSGTTDSTTANNSATDTDTPAVADLSIQKTATPNPVASGGQVVFTLIVTNHGPAAADGATVRDPAATGLDCLAAGLPVPTCSATGGATCPSPLTAADLQAGAAIPTLPNGGVVTLGMTCRVTASGLP